MYTIAFLAVVSFLLTLFLTPFVRNCFRHLSIGDRPGGRKTYLFPIPHVGGIAIFAAYLLAFVLVQVIHLRAEAVIWRGLGLVIRLAPAALTVFAIGLIDDIRGLGPWKSLIGEVAAAVMAYVAGIHVESFAYHHVAPWLSLPLTILWLVACMNAVNLIDGIDGLAAGVGLFAATTALFAALLQNNVALALATAPLAGGLLGFLRYNFNPATIFLGDCGSLLIGFLLGCYGILWSQKAATILGMTAPLVVLAVPLLDAALAMARRFLRRKPFHLADRGHIHHRLLDRGLSPRIVALALYAFCAFGAICSLLMTTTKMPGIVLIVFCLLTWIGVQQLGYVEFGITGRMFLDGAFRRALSSQIALQAFEAELKSATTAERCWEVVSSACRTAGFHRIEMTISGRAFDWEDGVKPRNSWDVRIPISDLDSVRLTRSFGGGSQPNMIPYLVHLIRKTLVSKRDLFTSTSCMPPKGSASNPLPPER